MTPASEWDSCNPVALRKRERELLELRRERAGVEPLSSARDDATLAVGRVGVGLSGGGIRSATLSLGFFQALSKKQLLPHVDYVSTVSGGGYFGACLGRLFSRGPVTDQLGEDSDAVGYLRNNGNYLAPNGSGDAILAIAILLRNWLATLTVVGTLVLFGFVAIRTVTAAIGLPPMLTIWGVVVSPLLVLSDAIFVMWVLPWGIAYWFVRWRREEQWQPKQSWLGTLLGWLASVLRWIPYLVLVVPLLGWFLSRVLRGRGLTEPEQRNVASSRLALALKCWGAVLLLGFADGLGAVLFDSLRSGEWGWLASAAATIAAIAAGARKITAGVGQTAESGWKARASAVVMPIVAFTAAGIGLALCAVISFAVAFAGPTLFPALHESVIPLLVLVVLAILSATFRSKWSFVNRSSFHSFYCARITRAYLGASNPHRRGAPRASSDASDPGEREKSKNVRKCDEHDDVEMADYRPHENGGPLHLINVTINETLIGRSQLQDVRSRGLGMAVGPAGLSVAARHHALWGDASDAGGGRILEPIDGDGFRVFGVGPGGRISCEPLTLGQWTAISGAAASTGVGANTTLPTSLLAGLFNVRLGYWWNSGVAPRPAIFAVQRALLEYEYLARFPGVSRRQWNLSDGGHFENLAGYELLRRRLPVVLICDFEQDEDYEFAGLGNLVRKARIDFDAHLRFVDGSELDQLVGAPVRKWFGSLDDLRRGRWDEEPVADPVTGQRRQRLQADESRTSRALFALAEVTYRDGLGGGEKARGKSWLIYVKSALLGDEPADLRQYHAAHPAFPHESTADQFFDEAQWESYRCLGEHLGDKLFAAKEGNSGADVPAEWFARGWVVDPTTTPQSANAPAKKKATRKKVAKKPAAN